MGMDSIISIIIPVYNAKKYLYKCVESILEQTFENYEIILVDDGSTDGSEELCDEISRTNDHVYTIHKQNGGVSSAREAGLKKAKGKYIAYIDADDYIDCDYLKILYEDACRNNADIVCCDCIEKFRDKVIGNFRSVIKDRTVNEIDEYIEDIITGKELYGTVVWGKIIKKDLLKNIHFKDIKYGEDTVYMLEVFSTKPVTRLNSYKGYYYVRNEDSATYQKKDGNVKVCIDHISAGEMLYYCAEKSSNPVIIKKGLNYYKKTIYRLIVELIRENDYAKYQEYYRTICEYIMKVEREEKGNSKYLIMLKIFKKFPNMYWKIFNMYYKVRYKGNI